MSGKKLPARSLAVAASLMLGVGVSACSSPGQHHSSSASAPSSSASSTPDSATASAPRAGGRSTLSKAEFTTKVDAVCTSVDAQLNALPSPSGLSDYATLLTDLTKTDQLFDSYIAAVTPLVDQSPDSVALQTGWLEVEEHDFAAGRPLFAQLTAALRAKDDGQIEAISKQLNAVPDHTDQIITVLNAHDLTGCAKLESDTEGSGDA